MTLHTRSIYTLVSYSTYRENYHLINRYYVNAFTGVMTRMKDQFRSRRVALWLNLIPDLVRSGQLELDTRMPIDQHDPEINQIEEEYLTYSETLPFIPSIKYISHAEARLPRNPPEHSKHAQFNDWRISLRLPNFATKNPFKKDNS